MKRREVLVTARYDQYLHFVAGSDLLWALREDTSGESHFDLFRPVSRR